jgi:hypothetical protein
MSEQNKETAREAAMRLLATNPRWKEAPKTGEGFVILGARTSVPEGKSDGENRQEERR